MNPSPHPEQWNNAKFPTTQWTHIQNLQGSEKDNALNQICKNYWVPLYVSARCFGLSPHDAEDAIQDFLVKIIEQDFLLKAEPNRGRLRSFLFSSLRNFITNRIRVSHRVRNGGGVENFIDIASAENCYANLLDNSHNPDRAFAIAWAQEMIQLCMKRLRQNAQAKNQLEIFNDLTPFLLQESEHTLVQLAAKRGISPENLRVTLFRLRMEFRNELHRQVAATVEDQTKVEEEIHSLLSILNQNS